MFNMLQYLSYILTCIYSPLEYIITDCSVNNLFRYQLQFAISTLYQLKILVQVGDIFMKLSMSKQI